MANKKIKRKKKKKKSLLKRFFSIVFSILVVYFFIMVAWFVYAYITYEPKENPNFMDKAVEMLKPTLPEYTNILLACTDEGEGRTDAIMIISYNSVSKKITLVSIPRDTKVSIPDDMWEVMVENFPVIKNDNPSLKKINAIPNYGQEQGMEFLQRYIEEMLDIEIDFYVHFNLEGFRHIVDSIGGVYFEVPAGGLRYSDPSQDLYINLQGGYQLLDGDKAEQLLRYRSYTRGDYQRVEVQQEFIKVFFEKITSLDSIISNPGAYFTTLTEYIETDIGISDILSYIPEVNSLDISQIESYTLPSTTEKINGIDFVIIDKNEVLEFSYDIFKKPTTIKEENSTDSLGLSIVVLNGGYTSGMASKKEALLEADGYTVTQIGDFAGEKDTTTRIYVSKDGIGSDLEKYFTSSKIIVSSSKTAEYDCDILIVIGSNE